MFGLRKQKAKKPPFAWQGRPWRRMLLLLLYASFVTCMVVAVAVDDSTAFFRLLQGRSDPQMTEAPRIFDPSVTLRGLGPLLLPELPSPHRLLPLRTSHPLLLPPRPVASSPAP
jgi:hypothetical protein